MSDDDHYCECGGLCPLTAECDRLRAEKVEFANRERELEAERDRLREALDERGYPFTLERENDRLRGLVKDWEDQFARGDIVPYQDLAAAEDERDRLREDFSRQAKVVKEMADENNRLLEADLRRQQNAYASRMAEYEAEVARLQRGWDKLCEMHEAAEAERDRLVQQNSEAVLLVAKLRDTIDEARLAIAQLERRNGRLRKAVNWLRGANHDAWLHPNDKVEHQDTPDHCAAWECQRARDILAEAKDE